MFVFWYLVLALWAVVACSKPLVLPVVGNDPAERVDHSSQGATASPQSDLILVLNTGSLQSEQDTLDNSPQPYLPSPPNLRRAVIPSTPEPDTTQLMDTPPLSSNGSLSVNLISPLPIYSSFFPVIAYSTLLAIIGFISVRIARWRNRRAHQGQVDAGGVELLPTNTSSISQRFKDLPVPPPLPYSAPHIPSKSASLTSLNSLVPRPTSPPLVPPWPQNRLSREYERPKSPLQHLGFSPGSKIKRRSTSLDLGHRKRNSSHGLAPTPLRRPFFISEPEPDHERLSYDQRYRDDDDDDDETTLIHLSPPHQRAQSHGQPLWRSTSDSNTLLPPLSSSHDAGEKTLIDYSSSLSFDKINPMPSPKQELSSGPAVSSHAPIWAFAAPETSAPSLPSTPPMKSALPLSSDEINLIDFSPKMKEKLLIDIGDAAPVGEVALSSHDKKETDKGYEGGDEEDEMDIAWGGGWSWEFAPSAPVTPKVGESFDKSPVSEEDDLVDTKSISETVFVGQPLSAVTMSSSTSTTDVPAFIKAEEVLETDIDTILDQERDLRIDGQEVQGESVVQVNENAQGHECEPTGPVLEPVPVLSGGDEEIHEHNDQHDFSGDKELQMIPQPESHSGEGNVPRYGAVSSVYDELIIPDEQSEDTYPPLPLSPSLSEQDVLPALSREDRSLDEETQSSQTDVSVGASQTVDAGVLGDITSTEDAVAPDLEKVIEPVTEMFPDPDLLPLPPVPVPAKSPQLEVMSRPPSPPGSSAPSPVSMQQTPTPPASPPSGNIALPPLSRSTSLANITNRPAWSVRAADMPPLGIHATNGLASKKSGDMGGAKNDENWESVKRRKVKEKGNPVKNSENEDTAQAEDAPKDVAEIKLDQSPKPEPTSPLASPMIPASSLPGSFPLEVPALVVPTTEAGGKADEPQLAPATSTASAVVKSASIDRSGRRTTTRSPIDIALAMQLRPGLGVGADPAWMVRFLMAMFGWFVVLISGSAGNEFGYAALGGAYVGARRRS
ncbi:hypothetical protein VNI00_008404 [Paramarasmius palmivorus]|uniref:Uncharacterized protein n=1 Tax=Paramarasmius palmivorus TaxID=297713 RepID=A0AAW0CZQ2_9AGAR